jgi:chorismate mutase
MASLRILRIAGLLALFLPLIPVTDAAAGDEPLRRLAVLLDERLELGIEVANAKWNSGQPIQDPPRERIVIDATVARAAELGIDRELAHRVIVAQIDASRALQSSLHEQWRTAGRGRFDDALDLGRDIRPRFDDLGPRLLVALAAAEQSLATAAGRAQFLRIGFEVLGRWPEPVRASTLAAFE